MLLDGIDNTEMISQTFIVRPALTNVTVFFTMSAGSVTFTVACALSSNSSTTFSWAGNWNSGRS